MKKKWIYPLLSFLIFIGIWYLLILIFQIPPYVLPTPGAVMRALIDQAEVLLHHSLVTGYEALVGLVIASITAFFTAIIMDRFEGVNHILYPLLVISQTLPTMVLAPLLTLWFGYGMLPKVILVILSSYFPIVIGFVDAMGQIPEERITFLRTLGAERFQIYRVLKIPQGMTGFFSGLKISSTYCVGGAIVGEWISAQAGLGYFMIRAQNSYAIDRMFASIVCVVILSLLFNFTARLIERAYYSALLKTGV